jgi:hypothetical protein
MDTTSLLYLVLIVAIIVALGTLRKRKKVDDFRWLPAIFGWMIEIFTGHKSMLDQNGPRRRRGPDMSFSAGRDAAHQNARLRQVFIPMEPQDEAALRAFYLQDLGLMEMRAPNSRLQQDGFWAVSGTRQIYLGTMPDFKPDFSELPGFPLPNLQDKAEQLDAAGYQIRWDTSIRYVRRLIVIDPAQNEIALIEA